MTAFRTRVSFVPPQPDEGNRTDSGKVEQPRQIVARLHPRKPQPMNRGCRLRARDKALDFVELGECGGALPLDFVTRRMTYEQPVEGIKVRL